MGITTLGAERATNPFLARAGPLAPPWPGRKSCGPRGAPSTSLGRTGTRASQLLDGRPRVLRRAGYEYLETPIFEDTDLFARGVGESTDIVQKEMFTFEDQGGRSITLRPEDTAGVCRAYVEHGMHKLPQPVRAWYCGPVLPLRGPAGRAASASSPRSAPRRSAPMTPRSTPSVILLLDDLLGRAGRGDCACGSRASATPRPAAPTPTSSASYLRAREDQLSDEVRGRLDANPLRAFDSDHEGTRAAVAEAPRLVDRLARRGRRPSRRGPRPARRRGPRLRARRHPGPRPRLLHAHGVRVHERRARRPERGRRRRPLRRAGRAAGRPRDAGDRLGGGRRAHPAGLGGPSRGPPHPEVLWPSTRAATRRAAFRLIARPPGRRAWPRRWSRRAVR